jgi:hypothetical protein
MFAILNTERLFSENIAVGVICCRSAIYNRLTGNFERNNIRQIQPIRCLTPFYFQVEIRFESRKINTDNIDILIIAFVTFIVFNFNVITIADCCGSVDKGVGISVGCISEVIEICPSNSEGQVRFPTRAPITYTSINLG